MPVRKKASSKPNKTKKQSKRMLYLMRHAKASRRSDDKSILSDIDRPINERGEKDASLVAKRLKKSGSKFDLIVCSPSVRTRETLDILMEHFPKNIEVLISDYIYSSEAEEVISLLRSIPDDRKNILVIGHNPIIESLALNFSDQGSFDENYEIMSNKFPTAAVAVIACNGSWKDVGMSCGHLLDFIRPKDLKSEI